MKKEWNIHETDSEAVKALSDNAGINPVTADLLIKRGVLSQVDALNFLNPSLNKLKSPFLIKDMDIAVQRISKAIQDKENILVFGDYDVDGITGTLVILEFLKYCNANVSHYIPHRIKEGYSFKQNHVKSVLLPRKTQLLITVDCGSDSGEAVALATEHGVDVIITDHHSVPEKPPQAIAIVNPKRKDCESGLEHLAGVGVALYLVMALRKQLRDIEFWKAVQEPNLKKYCELAALGTIADIVPLIHENRVLTKIGLDIINSNPRAGIKALINVSKMNKNSLTSEDIGFKIAPRLNAAGRIDHADKALMLLSSTDEKEAVVLAKSLDALNTERQKIEQKIIDEAEQYLKEVPESLKKPAIILSRQGWHPGVLGIVAARLSRNYNRPAILITFEGDTGKGSGRSVAGINLYEALSECSDTLKGFGGHAMAGGLEIKKDKLSSFTKKFNDHVHKETSGNPLPFQLEIHSKINFDDIIPDLINEIEQLQPFGSHNPEPLFITDDVSILSTTPVKEKHCRLVLCSHEGETDTNFMAMHFNTDKQKDYPGCFTHLVFRLQWNRWNNAKSPQIIVEDFI